MKCSHWLLVVLIAQCLAAPTQAAVEILGNTSSLRGGGTGPCSDFFVDLQPRPLGTFTSLNHASADCIAGPDGGLFSMTVTDEFTTTIDSSVIDVVHGGLYVMEVPPMSAGATSLSYDDRLSVSFEVIDEPVEAELSGGEYIQGAMSRRTRVTNADTGEVVLSNSPNPQMHTALLDEGSYNFEFEASLFYYDIGGVEIVTPNDTARLAFLGSDPVPEPSTIAIWSLLGVSTVLIRRRRPAMHPSRR